MTNLFLPYNLALLAKEKGFDKPCFAYYSNTKRLLGFQMNFAKELKANHYSQNNSLDYPNLIIAPLYQQIIDWFREKHDLLIYVHENACEYESVIQNTKLSFHCFISDAYLKYYEALNKAIEEAFKLI